MQIERVSYRSGFVERLEEPRRLPAITIEAADLPEDVLALLDQLTGRGRASTTCACPRNPGAERRRPWR